MLIILSPAKKLDFKKQLQTKVFSQASLLKHSKLLRNELRNYSIDKIGFKKKDTSIQRSVYFVLNHIY